MKSIRLSKKYNPINLRVKRMEIAMVFIYLFYLLDLYATCLTYSPSLLQSLQSVLSYDLFN